MTNSMTAKILIEKTSQRKGNKNAYPVNCDVARDRSADQLTVANEWEKGLKRPFGLRLNNSHVVGIITLTRGHYLQRTSAQKRLFRAN